MFGGLRVRPRAREKMTPEFASMYLVPSVGVRFSRAAATGAGAGCDEAGVAVIGVRVFVAAAFERLGFLFRG